MKKICLSILCISMLLSGCNDSDSPIDDAQKALLSVADVGFGLKSGSDKSKADFEDGDEIGLCLQTPQGSGSNKLTYLNPGWALENPVFLSESNTDIYAVYPYNAENSAATSFEIEHISRTDYLYSGMHRVNRTYPVLTLTMMHALALIEFEFEYVGMSGSSLIDFVSIDGPGLHSKASLNLLSGEIEYMNGWHDPAIIYGWEMDNPFISYDSKISLMVVPVKKVEYDGDISFNMLIDRIKYHWSVPAGTKWEGGKRYTYRIMIHERFLEIVDVRILEWVDAGKERIYLPIDRV